VSTAALYPLELIKTRMQVVESPSADMSIGNDWRGRMRNPYGSVFESLRTVLKNEGARGLYQGVTPAMIAASGSWGGYFFLYEQSKARKLRAMGSNGTLNTFDHLTSGVEAGVILVVLFNPLWLIKTRMALQGAELSSAAGTAAAGVGGGGAIRGNISCPPHNPTPTPTPTPTAAVSNSKYTGITNAMQTIVREEGILGLYKGVVPALFLTSHGAIQFAVYEWLKTMATLVQKRELNDQQPAWVSIMIGGSAKIVASTITYPYQVIKSRLQQREVSLSPTSARYQGMLDCIIKTYRQEGPLGFFRGVVPNALKVAPSAALTFVVYEEVLKLARTRSLR